MGIGLTLFVLIFMGAGSKAAVPAKGQVTEILRTMEKSIREARKDSDKFQTLRKGILEIKTIRSAEASTSASQEGKMDLLVSALESLPQEKEFRKRDCSKYENEFLTQFEPLAEEVPEEPALQPGWTVLKILCR